MKRFSRSVILKRLMQVWSRERPPSTELFMVPIASIDQVIPINVVKEGNIEEGTFTYTHNLN